MPNEAILVFVFMAVVIVLSFGIPAFILSNRRKHTSTEDLRVKYNLSCPVCKHTDFDTRNTLMNTGWSTFLNFDWLNKEAKNYICKNCGYVYWFFK